MHWEKEGAIIDSICADYGRTLLGWTGWTGLTLTGLGSLQSLEMENRLFSGPFSDFVTWFHTLAVNEETPAPAMRSSSEKSEAPWRRGP